MLINGPDAVYVFSLGYISRTAYWVRQCSPEKFENYKMFFMLGSMGLTKAIACGIAMHAMKEVVVVRGDGDYLFCNSDMIDEPPWNLTEYVLSNEIYESTGGQKCVPIEGHYTIKPSPTDPRINKDPKEIARDIIHCLAS